MATLVTALTLVALVRLCGLGYKPLELALLLAVIAGVVLWGPLAPGQWLLNVAGMYAASAAWFWSLQATDVIGRQGLHWLLLLGGFVALIGGRLYLDLIVYGVGL
jgi:hypothetical protein